MGQNHLRYKIFTAFFAAMLAGHALAEERPALQPLRIEAKYTVAWNGITIGRIRFSAAEESAAYRLSVDTKTKGIGAMFSDEKRISTAEGKRTPDGRYIASRYVSKPQSEGKEGSRTLLTYDSKGKLLTRQRTPKDDPSWRPLVPAHEITNAVDTTTAGLVLRRKLYDAITRGGNEATVRTYDGARLADLRFNVVKPEARVEIMHAYVKAVNTVVTRQPLDGYTPKELKKFKAGDPEVHLYFSDDARFLPIKATIDTSFGQLSATLVELN